MRLRRHAFKQREVVANPHAKGVRLRQVAVVIAAALPDPPAVAPKGRSGDKNEVDALRRQHWAVRARRRNAVITGNQRIQTAHEPRCHPSRPLAARQGERPATGKELLHERQQRDFAPEGHVGHDRLRLLQAGQRGEMGADGERGLPLPRRVQRPSPLAHALAQRRPFVLRHAATRAAHAPRASRAPHS